jgi:hypothetical protein
VIGAKQNPPLGKDFPARTEWYVRAGWFFFIFENRTTPPKINLSQDYLKGKSTMFAG